MEGTKTTMGVVGPVAVAASGIAEPLNLTVLKCFQDTLTSTQTANHNNNDKALARYNTRSHGEEEACHSLKSRAQDPRALNVATPAKWHGHVVLEGDFRGVEAVLHGPLPAGSPCEFRQVGGPSPEPCDQAFEPCPDPRQHGCLEMVCLTPELSIPVSPFAESDPEARIRSTDEVAAEDALLRKLQLDKRSLILHSLFPDKTPHIVITSPEEYIDPWANRLPVQWIGQIVVPPHPWQWVTYMSPPWEGHPGGWWYDGGFCPVPTPSSPMSNNTFNGACGTVEAGLALEQANAVNERDFKRQSSLVSQEQVQRFEALTSLHRDVYHIAARAASLHAVSIRDRWLEGTLSGIEKPFVWEDPATPLLSFFNRNRGIPTTILESPNPFLVPHIVIEEAPQVPYWECEYNRIPEQQAMGGVWLTVPSGRYKCRRYAQQEEQEQPDVSACTTVEMMPSTADLEGEYDEGQDEEPEATDSDSTLDSAELESPTDAGFDFGPDYPRESHIIDEDVFDGTLVGECEEFADAAQDFCCPFTDDDTFGFDDDEDDELPSLDDEFYQSTARQYGIDLHTS